MYHKKVPLFYKSMSFHFSMPKVPVEELFVNMVRNMNTDTHQFRGNVPFAMTVVSTSIQLVSSDAQRV
jgi:hypothetical protein